MPPKNIEETTGSEGINNVVADLQRQIHDLQSQLERGVPLKEAKRVTQHEARIMVYEGKPVVKIGKVFKKIVSGEEKLFIDITVRDEKGDEKTTTVDYLNVLNETPRVLCTIVKMNRETKEQAQGRIPQQARVSVTKSDPVGITGARDFSRRDVDLGETVETIMATVKIEEGELHGMELDLPAEALNP